MKPVLTADKLRPPGTLAPTATDGAGRMCPVDYRYAPAELDRRCDFSADVLYVVGGLYGNAAALDVLDALAAAELQPPAIVLNGDFHWFDADPDWFSEIERRVSRYRALRGNVETELARDQDIGAGCGCTYPESVDDGVVQRSNDILRALRGTAAELPGVRGRLARLPMHLVAQVGDLRVGIVHGDAASLAGWRFSHEALDEGSQRGWLDGVHRASRIDVFASTHTCLAALRDLPLPGGRLTVINNGAAGMPNFTGTQFGLISRIATSASPHPPLYGMRRDGVHIDAIALTYDVKRFLPRFLARWPDGSPAHTSYLRRIEYGPDHAIAQAANG
ncbi:MAG TPA: hypothetical protein VK281_00590 [Xanthobacteraceae bacterium]|nr:hypothetical protein [Xanthobacteraceae bacterium]